MYSYFLRSILRFFKHEKANIGICITGFTISLIAVFLISIYVYHEWSYDRFHKNAGNIYRIIKISKNSSGISERNNVILPNVKQAIQNQIPEATTITRIYTGYNILNFRIGEEYFSEKNYAFVDPEFFNVFSFLIIEGDPGEMSNPATIVLPKSEAIKYFGHESAINREITLGSTFRVVAVIEDFPSNSHFRFNMLLSMSSIEQGKNLYGEGASFYTYVKLGKNSDPAIILTKMMPVIQDACAERNREMGLDNEQNITFELQPLTDIHLYSHMNRELGESGNISYLWICILLVFFSLLIAGINFANIMTVLSEKKVRFFSINKVIGATSRHTNILICLEIALLILISFMIACSVIGIGGKWLILNILGLDITLNRNLWIKLITLFSSLSILLFGISIAFSFLSFSRITLLSGFSGMTRAGKSWNQNIYKTLLCIQLIIATFLIGCLYQTDKQLYFLKNKDLGLNEKNLIIFTDIPWSMQSNLETIKDKLTALPFVERVALSADMPGEQTGIGELRLHEDGEDKYVKCNILRVDSSYLYTMGISLFQGRNFNISGENDKNAVILNKTLAQKLAINDISNKTIDLEGENYNVIGITKDFHLSSLHNVIPPVAIILKQTYGRDIAIRSQHLTASNINQIKKTFKQVLPAYDTRYYFMVNKFASMYKAEERMSHVSLGLTIVSILIAFMGVWSFASLFIGKRWKEMGVRKVFGAQSRDLLHLLSKGFMPWITLSFVITIPLLYYFTLYFNSQFAYQVGMSPELFGIGIVFVSLLIIIAMAYHCHRIIKINPVKVLKHE